MSDEKTGPGESPTRVRLRVLRQDGPDKPETRRWEEFAPSVAARGTVASALLELQRRPVLASGGAVAPVAFEGSCLEGACGGCTMLIDGCARQACLVPLASFPSSAVISLAPLSKFPVERDLIVDRSRVTAALERVNTSLDARGSLRPGPVALASGHAALSRAAGACTACGACLEACPEFVAGGSFIGAMGLHQVRRLQQQTEDDLSQARLIDGAMQTGGVAECGKAQNCVEVCPVGLPLVDSIQQVARAATKRLVLGWILG